VKSQAKLLSARVLPSLATAHRASKAVMERGRWHIPASARVRKGFARGVRYRPSLNVKQPVEPASPSTWWTLQSAVWRQQPWPRCFAGTWYVHRLPWGTGILTPSWQSETRNSLA